MPEPADTAWSPPARGRVVRLHNARDLRVHVEATPEPATGERLVRVTAVGLCGSDLHWFDEGRIGTTRLVQPLVPGHEFAAVTADGQRVAADPAITCGACEPCRAGHPNLCERITFAGHDRDGALRDWIAWPDRCLHPIPRSLSDADAALLEPLGVALHAIDLAHIAVGATVGVFGCGPIGWLLIRVARLAGASRIFATDLASRPHRLDAARASGAEVFVADGTEARHIRAATADRGIDVAIEAAGDNEAIDAAVDAVRPGARVVLVGIPSTGRSSFEASAARRKGLTVALSRRMKHTYPRAIRLVQAGAIDLRACVTHRFSLDASGSAFEAASRREGLKVLVEP